MNSDKNLNSLLKWSIEAQAAAKANAEAAADGQAPASAPQEAPTSQLTPEMLNAIMGGPSDAELMQASMAHITSSDPEITLDSKLTAFDNLEQLIESIDNANMLGKLGLWTPLLELLGHGEPQIRLMAAWVIGTAVQNNEPCQERLLALGGVEKLVTMALGQRVEGIEARAGDQEAIEGATTTGAEDGKETKDVRRKAVYALSSAVRNYQPAMDVATKELAGKGESVAEKTDAMDMDAVDLIITPLREKAAAAA
ncbi:nucleotide exchange factor Fes1-domain-containing protein [Microdochium trichocladiopsis]|uniref:Nucleotide exchange factor Fes1-domain-containing protein n=1 Tax=Microdochium trichocladiopsis TaxID=1682393 RepID=A0A9P8YBG5_9PEZI|nr:nucleotide exchange factor Fes1-domain-containing protein [Microdochium trichocladiopsis]KAH7033127.1 nucleotide exchange factor Fes1-domain-containing protein [Microdochium trichocladiopsis]